MFGYLSLAYLIHIIVPPMPTRFASQFWIVSIFDSVTFAGSALILWGMFRPQILVLLGSTKPFLAIAAMVGLIYSLRALIPRDPA